jgi:hypothetical protein
MELRRQDLPTSFFQFQWPAHLLWAFRSDQGWQWWCGNVGHHGYDWLGSQPWTAKEVTQSTAKSPKRWYPNCWWQCDHREGRKEGWHDLQMLHSDNDSHSGPPKKWHVLISSSCFVWYICSWYIQSFPSLSYFLCAVHFNNRFKFLSLRSEKEVKTVQQTFVMHTIIVMSCPCHMRPCRRGYHMRPHLHRPSYETLIA